MIFAAFGLRDRVVKMGPAHPMQVDRAALRRPRRPDVELFERPLHLATEREGFGVALLFDLPDCFSHRARLAPVFLLGLADLARARAHRKLLSSFSCSPRVARATLRSWTPVSCSPPSPDKSERLSHVLTP